MDPAIHRAGRWSLAAGLLALAGCVFMPIAGYLAGKRFIGAYEGRLGLRDYLASIYDGAGSGDPAAWLLMATPTLLVLVWWAVWRTWRGQSRI